MKLTSSTLGSLAAIALGGAIWLVIYIQRPGAQLLASFAAGTCTWFTVQLIIAAARADARERFERDVHQVGGPS